MKKIYLFFVLLFLATTLNIANAANVQNAYQVYLNKLRTCSPYTYNVDGDSVITKIVGYYNRRCIVRTFTYTDSMECIFKNEELRDYLKAMPNAKIYAQSIGKTPAEMDKYTIERMQKYSDKTKELKDKGICVSSDSLENGNGKQN